MNVSVAVTSSAAGSVGRRMAGLARLILPEDWNTTITPYLPSSAGSAFTSVTGSDTLLGPTAGAAVFVGWLVVLLAGAAIMIRRRDA